MQKQFAFLALAVCALPPSPVLAQRTERVLYIFGQASNDPSSPQDGVIADKDGNLYGTSAAGGAHGDGTVFKITADGQEQVIYSFAGGATDGAVPDGGVAMDDKGNLFGTTNVGGSKDDGTVFELSPNPDGKTYTEKVIYFFCPQKDCIDGRQPKAGVVIGKNDVLYGTTQLGGTSPFYNLLSGVVWRLTPPGKHETIWNETVLHNFCQKKATSVFVPMDITPPLGC